MKKSFFTLLITVFVAHYSFGQFETKFGITGGLLNTNTDVNISALGFNIAEIDAINETGFYAGFIADIAATDKFHIQPELTYGQAGDLAFVYLPIMAKFYVADKFFLQAGPQFSYSHNLNEIKKGIQDIQGVFGSNADLDDVLNATALDFAFGLGYAINEHIMVQARYGFAITDRYDGPLKNSLDVKTATIKVGIAYLF